MSPKPSSDVVSAFDWGKRKLAKPEPQAKERKYPIGVVRKVDVASVPALKAEFKLANGGPLKFVNAGKVICQIFEASANLTGTTPPKFLSKILEDIAYHVERMGPEGVTPVVVSAKGTLHEEPPTVAYFVGNDFKPKKP